MRARRTAGGILLLGGDDVCTAAAAKAPLGANVRGQLLKEYKSSRDVESVEDYMPANHMSLKTRESSRTQMKKIM